jgi:hypothetical protein
MDAILEMLSRGVEQLVGRAGGPLHFRLLIMPLVVTTLAVRAGLRDAREGQPAFLWALLTNPAERRRLLRSALKDVGRIFIVAVVLDTAYQLMVLRALYPGQLLIVAVTCAMVPYVVIRGPVTRLTRWLYRHHTGAANPAAANPKEETEGRLDPNSEVDEPRNTRTTRKGSQKGSQIA